MKLETASDLVALLGATDLPEWAVAWPPTPDALSLRLHLSRGAADRFPQWFARKVKDTPALVTEYDTYLIGDHWRNMRRVVYLLCNFRCAGCGVFDDRLQVHHRTYERIGAERLDDLEPLCAKCHAARHATTSKGAAA